MLNENAKCANLAVVIVCDKWSEEDDFMLASTPFERNTHAPKGENREYVCEKDRGVIERLPVTDCCQNTYGNFFCTSIKDTCSVFVDAHIMKMTYDVRIGDGEG